MKLFSSQQRSDWKVWHVRVYVLLSLALQIVLTIFGKRRRSTRKVWVRIIVWCAYLAADYIAIAALGVISSKLTDVYDDDESLSLNIELISFWAPFLLSHLGGPDTITAYSVEDNKLWLRHLIGLVVQMIGAIYVLLLAWTGSLLSILSVVMICIGVIKYGERTMVLKTASDQKQLIQSGTYEGFRSSWTEAEHRILDDYLTACVFMEDNKGRFIDNFNSTSRAIVSHSQQMSFRKIFRVIEIELGMIYDILYTKTPLLYTPKGICLRVISFIVTCGVLGCFIRFEYNHFHNYSKIDLYITFVLLGAVIILDIYSLLAAILSDQLAGWLSLRGRTLTLRALTSFPMLSRHRWSNNMSQFSFISFVFQNKPLPRCNFLIEWLNMEENQEIVSMYMPDKQISTHLKELIFKYFKGCPTLRDFRLVLEMFPTPPEYKSRLGSDMEECIVTSHIVTELLYYLDREAIKDHGLLEDCKMYRRISRYMMHLLVAHPSMMRSSKDKLFHFQGKRYGYMRSAPLSAGLDKAGYCRALFQSCSDKIKNECLVIQRLDDIAGPTSTQSLRKKWNRIKVLWFELLAYAAVRSKGSEHADQLRRGGEFLTHLSFLLSHLGLSYKYEEGVPPTISLLLGYAAAPTLPPPEYDNVAEHYSYLQVSDHDLSDGSLNAIVT